MSAARSPALYFDLASPYAYLAVERAERVLGAAPRLEPILLGALFRLRGHGSWAHTDQLQENVAELERRAARYGLPPFVWPEAWPANSLAAMRACLVARRHGALEAFAKTVYRRHFVAGNDLGDVAVLADCAAAAGLDPDAMRAAIQSPEVKQELKDVTAAAWEAGVRGVPSLLVGDTVLFGDDRLEEAAALVAAR
jgi:2-hydroxychromene-2-carboxylate isomerase